MVHLVARQQEDLSGDLSALADRDTAFKNPGGRGDEFAHGSPGDGDADRLDHLLPLAILRSLHAASAHVNVEVVDTRPMREGRGVMAY